MHLVYYLWKRVSRFSSFPWSTRRLITSIFGSLELDKWPTFLHYIFSWETPSAKKFPESWVITVGPIRTRSGYIIKEESIVWEVQRKLSIGSRHLPLGVDKQSRLTVTASLKYGRTPGCIWELGRWLTMGFSWHLEVGD